MDFKSVIWKSKLPQLYFNLKIDLNNIRIAFIASKQIRLASKNNKPSIYYLGVPSHANLGDLAQGYCIRLWLRNNYQSYNVVEIDTYALVETRFSKLGMLKKYYNNSRDFVVFQSGYTTTDLGGHADLMHQAVMNILPNARILMMPQTIFFKSADRKELCSKTYNMHKNMLYLARDSVSFKMAEEMFPNITVRCFPDIVTTLIGKVESNDDRNGICFCLRDDEERYYPEEELTVLIDKCKSFAKIERIDTTKKNVRKVVTNSEKYIFAEIKEYAKFRVMITDRYHGTILSLVAGTPVVIIKTTDHKVTTGAEWFKGVYDDHVYLANDLNNAYELAKSLYSRTCYPTLKPYYEEKYYDKLPELFLETVGI